MRNFTPANFYFFIENVEAGYYNIAEIILLGTSIQGLKTIMKIFAATYQMFLTSYPSPEYINLKKKKRRFSC